MNAGDGHSRPMSPVGGHGSLNSICDHEDKEERPLIEEMQHLEVLIQSLCRENHQLHMECQRLESAKNRSQQEFKAMYLKCEEDRASSFQNHQDKLVRISMEDHILQINYLNQRAIALEKELNARSAKIQTLVTTVQQLEAERNAEGSISCGSYLDESATPILLHNAYATAKTAVTTFCKQFLCCIRKRTNIDDALLVNLLQPKAYYARPRHVDFAVKAEIYAAFFQGFENESFDTCGGICQYLYPGDRCAMFYSYFTQNNCEQQSGSNTECTDLQLESFYEMKVSRIVKGLNLRFESFDRSKNLKPGLKVSEMEILGGAELVAHFKAAARRVWLLHRLAFSFEPPASIFRVAVGADLDADFMEPVVNLEDDERFVCKVGFMVAPGLRLRKSVIRSEIYLAGAR